MELVVDANILVAGFLKSSVTRELFLDERLSLWAPEYGLTETEKVLLSERFRRGTFGDPSKLKSSNFNLSSFERYWRRSLTLGATV